MWARACDEHRQWKWASWEIHVKPLHVVNDHSPVYGHCPIIHRQVVLDTVSDSQILLAEGKDQHRIVLAWGNESHMNCTG